MRSARWAMKPNGTRQRWRFLGKNIAALENGTHGLCFGSGMAATDAIMKLFNPTDEIISCNDLYGGSYRIFTKMYARYGLKFNFTDMNDAVNVAALITPNTKLIWIETPTNPMLPTT